MSPNVVPCRLESNLVRCYPLYKYFILPDVSSYFTAFEVTGNNCAE